MLPNIVPSVLLAILTLTRECTASVNFTGDGGDSGCEVRARTQAGWVCGVRRWSEDYSYASFYNVPYARQPVGELRFKELQPAEPWDGLYDATQLGPICPQMSDLYGRLMTSKNISEACIHANIHAPLHALKNSTTKLPVFVFIHGGGFVSGSGDPDVHGPEYLIKREMIIITFNYRLHIFGFLSLNSSSVPGNNGLRDAVTLLKWVQVNVENFGGNPNDVTLAGQSAGAACAHLLTLSKAAEGLFKRTILMSGVGVRGFFTASQKYAKEVANLFISNVGINATDPEQIHQQLIATPLETLMNAAAQMSSHYFSISFSPVIETTYANVTAIIDQDPEVLLNNGQGNNISLLISFTNLEEEFFMKRFRENNMLESIQNNSFLMVPLDIVYKVTKEKALKIANETENRYFNGTPTVEKYGKYWADSAFVYPAMKLAQVRALNQSAPVYLYQFKYNASFSAIKVTQNITYDGAAHVDDLIFVFKANSMNGTEGFEPPSIDDAKMREQMTSFVKNFMYCNDPVCDNSNSSTWLAEDSLLPVKYEKIVKPDDIYYTEYTKEEEEVFQYFESIYNKDKC